MATETFKYFIADLNLRSDYGGDLILSNSDTSEVSKETLCLRHLCNQLNLPANYTQHLATIGTATGGIQYIKVPDLFYSAISGYLTTSELASVVSTAPTGFSGADVAYLQPFAKNKTLICRGDSITEGASMSGKQFIYASMAIKSIAGQTLTFTDEDRYAVSKDWGLINLGIGGSSWGNTSGSGNAVSYPRREDLAFNQRIRTLPLNGNASNNIFCYWLGTNDLDYDTSLSGADVWARAVTRINAFRAQFPNVKLILCTVTKRSVDLAQNGDARLNVVINDYNTFLRNNYASIGVNAIADFEGEVSQYNINTGDTRNTTYYAANQDGLSDGVHLTDLGHTLLAPVFKNALLSII